MMGHILGALHERAVDMRVAVNLLILEAKVML